MAVWQFTVTYIPTNWAKGNNYSTLNLYDDNGYFVTSTTWLNRQPLTNFKELLSEVLPVTDSWSCDMLL